MTIITKSPKETSDFGKNMAPNLNGGDIILLSGELGAGKTHFTKGLADGLSVRNEIVSPTFTIMNTYLTNSKNIKTLAHIDTYRLKDKEELIEIGIEDYLGQTDTLCVIEWPEKIIDLLPKDKKIISITIKHLENNQREIVAEDYFLK